MSEHIHVEMDVEARRLLKGLKTNETKYFHTQLSAIIALILIPFFASRSRALR